MKSVLAVVLMAALSGCYVWRKGEDVERVRVIKIETELAGRFCSDLTGEPARSACFVRMRNTSTGEHRCVIVVPPNDLGAVMHEAGGHCMGYDH